MALKLSRPARSMQCPVSRKCCERATFSARSPSRRRVPADRLSRCGASSSRGISAMRSVAGGPCSGVPCWRTIERSIANQKASISPRLEVRAERDSPRRGRRGLSSKPGDGGRALDDRARVEITSSSAGRRARQRLVPERAPTERALSTSSRQRAPSHRRTRRRRCRCAACVVGSRARRCRRRRPRRALHRARACSRRVTPRRSRRRRPARLRATLPSIRAGFAGTLQRACARASERRRQPGVLSGGPMEAASTPRPARPRAAAAGAGRARDGPGRGAARAVRLRGVPARAARGGRGRAAPAATCWW